MHLVTVTHFTKPPFQIQRSTKKRVIGEVISVTHLPYLLFINGFFSAIQIPSMEAQNQSEVSAAASTSIHQAPVEQQESRVSHYLPLSSNGNEPFINDDILFCILVVITFWFFVSVTLMMGLFGTSHLRLGPNCSMLIKPNPFFVDYIKVEQLQGTGVTGEMLYRFYEVPPLDVVNNWSVSQSAALQANSRKDWIYFLNEGSEINISYSVDSSSSSSLILAIAQGNDGFAKWIVDPSYPNTTLSWNIIHGNGMIQHDIKKSSTYYIGVSNLNSEAVEVNLNLIITDFRYNTTDAYFTCALAQGECSLKTLFPKGNAAVLTTPGPKEGMSYADWYVKLFFVPRWSTYLVGIGGISLLMLVVFHFFTKFCCIRDNRIRVQSGEMGPTRVPLLSQKDDDDVSSWGSSYDSGSQDGDDPEDGIDKPLIDGEYNINTRRLCVICFDAPRDCFFLPCGHCAACFACGTRIAEGAKSCPICRRRMKKVKKLFTV